MGGLTGFIPAMLVAGPGFALGQFLTDGDTFKFFSGHRAPPAEPPLINTAEIFASRRPRSDLAQILTRVRQRPAASTVARTSGFPFLLLIELMLVVAVKFRHQLFDYLLPFLSFFGEGLRASFSWAREASTNFPQY